MASPKVRTSGQDSLYDAMISRHIEVSPEESQIQGVTVILLESSFKVFQRASGFVAFDSTRTVRVNDLT